MKFQNTPPILDYRAFRLLMGFIAILLGPIVTIWANTSLSSVSASYHTNAQDVFVGLLFVVSAFLWAYNGHTSEESRASKAASAAALLVALFPTACGDCDYDWVAYVHAGAATLRTKSGETLRRTPASIVQDTFDPAFSPRSRNVGEVMVVRLPGRESAVDGKSINYFGCGQVRLPIEHRSDSGRPQARIGGVALLIRSGDTGSRSHLRPSPVAADLQNAQRLIASRE